MEPTDIPNTHSAYPPAKASGIHHTSIYTGVTYILKGATGRWKATIKHQMKKIALGVYDREEDAARAFDRAALKYRGVTARTNFPGTDYAAEADDLAANPSTSDTGLTEPGPSRKRKLAADERNALVAAALDQPPLITTAAFKPKGPLTDIRPTPINCSSDANPALDTVQKAIAEVMGRPLEVFMPTPDDGSEDLRTRQCRALDWCRSQLMQAQQLDAIDPLGEGGDVSADVQTALQTLDGMAGGSGAQGTPGSMGTAVQYTHPVPTHTQTTTVAPTEGPRKYKGVSWVQEKGKYRAQFSRGKDKKSHLGYFFTAEEAAAAYDKAAFAQKGSAAKLNFPDVQPGFIPMLVYANQAPVHQSTETPEAPGTAPRHVSPPDTDAMQAAAKRPRGRPKKLPTPGSENFPQAAPAAHVMDPVSQAMGLGVQLPRTPDEGKNKELKSKYMGVYRMKNWHYRAVIKDSKNNNNKISLGHFKTEEEAAQAFDRAAISMRGRTAKTNFPVSYYPEALEYGATVDESSQGTVEDPPPPHTQPYTSSYTQPMAQHHADPHAHRGHATYAPQQPSSSGHNTGAQQVVTAVQLQPVHASGGAGGYTYQQATGSTAVVYASSSAQQHGYSYAQQPVAAVVPQGQYASYAPASYSVAHAASTGQQTYENGRMGAQQGTGMQQYAGSWPYWGRG